MAININAELIAAGTKYRKELLAMPVAALSELLAHMTLKTGIQGKEVGGELLTDAELRPYRTAKPITPLSYLTNGKHSWAMLLKSLTRTQFWERCTPS
jgi:hypothetical protein